MKASGLRVVVVHGGDEDSHNLTTCLNGLPRGLDPHITGKDQGREAVAESLGRECDILMICGHGYRDGDMWCMGGPQRGWLTPSGFPQPFLAKLVVFDACGVDAELLQSWQQSGFLAAETVVAYGGGRRTEAATRKVQRKQNLVIVGLLRKLIDAGTDRELDAASCSPSGLRGLLECCIQNEPRTRFVYHLFPERTPA